MVSVDWLWPFRRGIVFTKSLIVGISNIIYYVVLKSHCCLALIVIAIQFTVSFDSVKYFICACMDMICFKSE